MTGGLLKPKFKILGKDIAGSKKIRNLTNKPNQNDLAFLRELIEAGQVTPVIDRSYPLSEVSEALRYYGQGIPKER